MTFYWANSAHTILEIPSLRLVQTLIIWRNEDEEVVTTVINEIGRQN